MIKQFWLRFHWKALVFDIFAIGVFLLLAWTIESQGWRSILTGTTTKLYKTSIVVLLGLDHYAWAHKIDLANVAAVALVVIGSGCGMATAGIMLNGRLGKKVARPEVVHRFFYAVTGVLLTGEAYLFYRGVQEQGLFGETGDVTAAIATVIFFCLLVAAIFIHTYLRLEDE
jgi:hypothetical protein